MFVQFYSVHVYKGGRPDRMRSRMKNSIVDTIHFDSKLSMVFEFFSSLSRPKINFNTTCFVESLLSTETVMGVQ